MNKIVRDAKASGKFLSEMREDPAVSIIIAAYNAEAYILRAVRSALRQTVQAIEVIVVDDGSTDLTASLVSNIAQSDPRVRLICKENGGQGIARNLAIRSSRGTYITILDADDELPERAIEYLLDKAVEQNADFVRGEMVHRLPDGTTRYRPLFGGKKRDLLERKDIRAVLRETYFSMGVLYKRETLEKGGVTFGEGYIYEDVEFLLGALVSAKRASAIPHPVYRLNVTEGSTTRSNHATGWHGESFVKAVESSINKHSNKLSPYENAFATYVLNKSLFYMKSGRVGARYIPSFARGIMSQLRRLTDISPWSLGRINRFAILCSRISPIAGFGALVALRQGHKIRKRIAGTESAKRVALLLSPYVDKYSAFREKTTKKRLRNRAISQGLSNNIVLFHGFDGKIRGNTKYALEVLSERGYSCYVCSKENLSIPNINVITLWSPEFHYIAARARFHILETWGNLAIGKRPGSVWIQMWHGTPLKRLLLDSPEKEIARTNPNHVMHKLRDVQRWDYLCAQNGFGRDALSSAFAFDRDRIILTGYPRMVALSPENVTRHQRAIREKYNIPDDKKIVLYAETWRDYNYKTDRKDFSYRVNWRLVPDEFFADHVVLFAGHPFGAKKKPDRIVETHSDDFQHLLAAADMLITDYSSALFDYLSLGRPFCLFMKDLERYESVRGVYPKVLQDFEKFIATDEGTMLKVLKRKHTHADRASFQPYLDVAAADAPARLADFVDSIRSELDGTSK